MAYRQLMRDEIIQLGQELDDLRHWEGARDYVSLLYGLDPLTPHGHAPHQITISITYESAPHRNYRFREATSVIVTDARNTPVHYDFSRHWWSQFDLQQEAIEEFLRDTSGNLERASVLGQDVLMALEDLCTEKLDIEFREHERRRDPITFTYIIDTPPSISFPAVYVPE